MHIDISKVADNNELKKYFSEKLFERRNAMGFTKTKLAESMREIDATITVSTISRWELGETLPSYDNLYYLQVVLGEFEIIPPIPDQQHPEVSKYSFSEQLEYFYKRKFGTQTAFANMIYVAQNTVSDWKNNKAKPDPDMMETIIDLLDVPEDIASQWRKYHTNTKRR